MEAFLTELHTNIVLQLVCIVTVLDTVFGVLRAWKQHEFNSSFGINGTIRKIGIIFASISLFVIDYLLHINFLPFVPDSYLQAIHLTDVGLTELFGIMFIVCESTSILKNMMLIGLPIPKTIKSKLEEWLKKNTEELEDKEK